MADIPLPLIPTPYRINDFISYITHSGDIKYGVITNILDYDAGGREINTSRFNSPRVFHRDYFFVPTRDPLRNPRAIKIGYKYVERLPNKYIIHQKWLIDNLKNGDTLNAIIPEFPDKVAKGNIGSTPYYMEFQERNNDGNGGTGGTSGGRRKRTRRHRSRRNRSKRSK